MIHTATLRELKYIRKRRGHEAEEKAARFLQQAGYHLLDKNFSSDHGEVDLVAQKEDMLCFVEVKARPKLSEAWESISRRKRQKIVKSAWRYLQKHPHLEHLNIRFDVVLLAGEKCMHIPCAWLLEGGDSYA